LSHPVLDVVVDDEVEFLPRGVEEERDNRILADVLGDIVLRVLRPHLFLVNVLFEDVTEDVGVDLVVPLEGALVEAPVVGVEEREELLERLMGNLDRCAVKLFDLVGHEDAAVEVGHFAEKLAGLL
jgi:hypothetical protein